MLPISSLAAPDRMTVTSTGTERLPRVVADAASVNAASFGFRVRCGAPLRFLRSGGGTELLDVVVASEPARRPAIAPCADWPLAGVGGKVRGTLYQLNQSFEFWTTDIGAYRVDPEAGRIEMPACDDHLAREQRLWITPAALCFMHRGDVPLHAAAVETDAGAVLLAAPHRHGKSTLALAFHRLGFRVLSEDLACCRLDPDPTLLPSPALFRIRPDVYDGRPPAGTHIVATRPGRVYIAVDADRRGNGAPVPITAIVFLRESASGIAIERAPVATAIRDLWTLGFHLPTQAARARSFTQLTQLADAVPAWNLYRPAQLGALAETVARVVEVCRA